MSLTEISDEELVERDDGYVEDKEDTQNYQTDEVLGDAQNYQTDDVLDDTQNYQTDDVIDDTQNYQTDDVIDDTQNYRTDEVIDDTQNYQTDEVIDDTQNCHTGDTQNYQREEIVEFDDTQYLRADPHGRTEKTTPLLHIKQGSEPPNFKSQFHGWNHKLWKQIQRASSTSSANEDQQVQQHTQSHSNNVTNVSEELEQYDKFFSYQELTRKRPPAGVDPTCKEKYLTDDEFEQVFGMTKAEYYTKPKWRQVDHKKKVNLF